MHTIHIYQGILSVFVAKPSGPCHVCLVSRKWGRFAFCDNEEVISESYTTNMEIKPTNYTTLHNTTHMCQDCLPIWSSLFMGWIWAELAPPTSSAFNMFQHHGWLTNQRQTWPLDFPLFPATGLNTELVVTQHLLAQKGKERLVSFFFLWVKGCRTTKCWTALSALWAKRFESQNTRVQDNPTLKGMFGNSWISRCFLTWGGPFLSVCRAVSLITSG